MKRISFDIDVVGACNLRCPSCPQGNVAGYRLPQGFMAPDLLARIIAKARSECRVMGVGLFNWAEPMLHPDLPELVRIVQKDNISCFLSSNLNILRDADALMSANPFSFRISASGFSQEVYGSSHRGGNIERVKMHMKELADAKKQQNATTNIYVYYHRYRHNLKEELMMREFAESLGFGFQPVWALFFPVEKILGYVEGDDADFPLTGEDRQLLERLALPLGEALEVSQKFSNRPCSLREGQVSIDFQGNVQLCCGIFHAGRFTIGHYLDMPLDEIQRLRKNHSMCIRCMRRGVHVYVTYGAHELEELAVAHITKDDAELLDLRYELTQKRLRRGLEKVYERVFAGVISTEQKVMLGSQFDRMQRLLGRTKNSFRRKG